MRKTYRHIILGNRWPRSFPGKPKLVCWSGYVKLNKCHCGCECEFWEREVDG